MALSALLLLAPASSALAQTGPAHAAHEPSVASREGSGTSWLPGVTPMNGFELQPGAWALMLHGNLFAQFLYESGEEHRTGQQAGSINWFMLAAERPVGAARLGLRAMMSLEPVTIAGCGYPNLLATGEVCDGDTIHDRQHPHDLVMELAAAYDRPLAGSLRWQLYGGLAGEPALGPPAFPHRLSAFPNPIAPIAHHWLDSTHISFGVITTGVHGARWKAEASAFNGREPDEGRFDLDLDRLDSFSARVSLAPTPRVALQVSAAHLEEAEAALGSQPPADVDRVTASAIYHRPLAGGAIWAATAAYGQNDETSVIPDGSAIRQRTHALLVEASLTSDGPHAWFGRVEVVGKPAHDLHIHEYITEVFTVGKIQGGYTRSWNTWKGLRLGAGVTVSASLVPPKLAPRYGGQVAPGAGVFVNLAPPRH